MLCASFAFAGALQAQVDPRGAMRTLATPHFRVHVREGQEPLARRSAAIAERAYAQLARELATPAGPIDLLIADNVDYSNGFAQVFPTNRVVIYAVPPVGSTELRFHDDWLRAGHHARTGAHLPHRSRARDLACGTMGVRPQSAVLPQCVHAELGEGRIGGAL